VKGWNEAKEFFAEKLSILCENGTTIKKKPCDPTSGGRLSARRLTAITIHTENNRV